MKVLKSQLREWLDSSIKDFLQERLQKKLEECFNARAEYMVPGDAWATQEHRMFLLGQESVLFDLIDLFNIEEEILPLYFGEDLVDDEGVEEEWKTQAEYIQQETESSSE